MNQHRTPFCVLLDEEDKKDGMLRSYEKMNQQYVYADVVSLFPLLQDVPKKNDDPLIKPSDFIKEMSMTTEERLQQLLKIHRNVKCADITSTSFKILPDIVIFQNCVPGEHYSVPLTIINAAEVSKPLQVIFHESYFFSMLHTRRDVATKIAPGIPHQLFIRFSPDQYKDYQHKITINSENESFPISIVAIGPRPLLDFPDEITLPSVPVKIEAERNLFIHNLGNARATFRMHVLAPFSIDLKTCVINAGEHVKLTIKYKPMQVGPIQETLSVSFESGEVLGVLLKGYAENVSSMHLSETSISFEDTYMGLTRQETIDFRNTSKHIVKYAWKLYSTEEEDKARWEALRGNMKEMCRYHQKRNNMVEYHNVCSGDGHQTICERMLQDEIDDMERQASSGEVGGPLFFGFGTDGIFEIIPEFGEIWPNTSVMFTVIFKPDNALSYCRNVYFDVCGAERRTKLSLYGTGRGPAFELNMQFLDAQNIFLCASHRFEIVAHNKGIIPGTIGFAKKQWDFGAEITFLTEERSIFPGEIGAFVFEFHSRIQGKFVEDVQFIVKESHEIIKMIMKGNVICPLLAFDIGEVNFGPISLGVPYVKKFNLLNNCQVPIEFSCSIPDDGFEHAVICGEFSNMKIKELPDNPKEFDVTPLNGTVPGYSSITVTITLISNIVQHLMTMFILNMWGSNNYKETLSVEYISNIPNIICKTPELHVHGCFINYAYTRSVILKNQSEFSGIILVDLQRAQFNDGITYTCPVTDFFVQPYGEVRIVITMVTNVIGESRATLAVNVFGSRKYSLSVAEIVCSGIGPTISFQPDVMDFENISTLTTYSASIVISNDSAIPATVEIVNHGKVCKLDETHFVIEPNQVQEVVIRIYLKVACKFQEKLKVKVEDGDTVFYTIKAIATGSSILCTPKLEPELDLGYLYTNKPFSLDVVMKNESPFNHKIYWTRLKYIKTFNLKEIPVSNIPSIFSMTPAAFDLGPGGSIMVTIEAMCSKPNTVEEDFYCHALVGKDKKTVIMSYILKASFITPVVERNIQMFHFRQDLGIEITVNFLEDILKLYNNSKLPVTMDLMVEEPFFIKHQGLVNLFTLSLEDQEEKSVTIAYEPKYDEKKCFIDHGNLFIQYVGLPTTDQVPIIGEVNFPTIQLLPNSVDFGCLSVGTDSYVLVMMKNISPLRVNYFIEFYEDDFKINKIEVHEPEIDNQTVKQPDFTDIVSFTSKDVKAEPSISQITPDKMRCGYNAGNEWIECKQVFCSCKPNQYRNIKTVLEQLLHPNQQNQIIDTLQSLHKEPRKLSILHQVFDTSPTAGYLDPYECKILCIAFNPIPNTQVSAKLQIRIQEGATEVLPIVGKCADLTYTFDECIEFGIQLFCEIAERSLNLQNTSYEAVLYKVHHEQQEDLPTINGWPQGFYIISPKTGSLEPNESINLNVKYFPGCPGEFRKNVVIKIGHFKPICVLLHGYAIYPQVYIHDYYNFADSRNNEDTTIGYNAIATLSLEYLLLMKDWRLSQLELYNNTLNTDALNSLFMEDWEVVVYHTLFPSEKDINLAIERYLASAVTLQNPPPLKDHVTKNRAMFIPRFAIQAYHLDFGLVIINSEAQLPVSVECYVHYDVDLRLVCMQTTAHMAELGLTLLFKKMILHPGDVQTFYVIFKPTSVIFTEPDVEISYVVNFSIAHGPIIPMKISAFVTTPRAHTFTNFVDFGDVQCGMAVRQSMILENSGRVPCRWKARLLKQMSRLGAIFHLHETFGVLLPGESTLIYITFQPEYDGPVKGNVKITIDDNPGVIELKVKGVGIESKLTIADDFILFNPGLPYSYHERYITIKNKGTVPLEFVFSDFDTKTEEENVILRLLMKYYNTNTLYIPPLAPGSPLPEPLINFYDFLQEDALEWLMHTKHDVEECSTENIQNKIDCPSKISVINRHKTAILAKLDGTVQLFDTFFEKREEIIGDYIKLMRDSKSEKFNRCKMDPIAQTIAEAKEPEAVMDPTDMREGVLLIFTGAPFTNAVETANRASIVLKLPVVNVNGLIYDALLRLDTLAAIKINDMLSEAYESLAFSTNQLLDPYETLMLTMDIILSGKPLKTYPKSSEKSGSKSKASSKSKSSKSKSSKGKGRKEATKVTKSKTSTKSPKTAKKVKSEHFNTLLNIPIELIIEVLQNSLLTYENGVIIESVQTHFITDQSLVLNSILKAAGNIRHIQIITFLYTWDNYLKFEEEQRETQKLKEEEELALKIIYFENMDSDQFEQLTPADRVLFKKHIILKRREITKYRIALAGRSRLSRINLRKQNRKIQEKKLAEAAKKSIWSDKQLSSLKTGKLSSKTSKSSKKSKKSKFSKTNTDDSKTTKKSKKNKKAKSGSRKGETRPRTDEEEIMKAQFHTFEQFYINLLHLVEFWNRKICDVTKPFPVAGKAKLQLKKRTKSKSSKGSAKISAKKTLPPKPSEEKLTQIDFAESVENEVGAVDRIRLGIPCWIFDNAHLDNLSQRVADYLKNTTELKLARQQIINSKMDEPLQETSEYFSVLYQPEDRADKHVSDVFKISDAEPLFDISIQEENAKANEMSKQNLSKSKRRASIVSKRSNKPDFIPHVEDTSDLISFIDPSAFYGVTLTPRVVIHPNETIRYRVLYHPICIGEDRHIYTIETCRWPKKYELACFGTADIPRILNDPNVLFSRKINKRNTIATMIKSRVFVLELDMFDFGHMLLRQPNDSTLLMKEAVFTLINHSLLPCIIKIYLKDTENDVFSLERTELIITPNNSVQLIVFANPHLEQVFENKIYICVKDNPEVYIVNVSCTGCVPQFTVHPKVLSFDRILYQSTEKKSVTLQNDSPVSLRWYFVDMHAALQIYKCSPRSGLITGFGNQQVEFVFTADTRGEFPPVRLNIEVVDEQAKVINPIINEYLEITAEVIDVTIEYETHINFGNIKGKTETIIDYHMVNHAKYDVEYIFTPLLVPDTPAYRLQRKAIIMTKIYPSRGILKPNKPFTAHIHIKPYIKMEMQCMPVMSCNFMETYFNQLIAQFHLVLTGRIHLSTFELCPQSEILFGRQLVEFENVQTIAIKNVGLFSFSYAVVSIVDLNEEVRIMSALNNSLNGKQTKDKKKGKNKKGKSKGSRGKSKSTKSTNKSKKSKSTAKTKNSKSTSKGPKKDSKTKLKKKKKSKSGTRKSKKSKRSGISSTKSKTGLLTMLHVGVFKIMPSTGLIEPGETVSIKISSIPIDVLSYEETILFFVSAPLYADRHGRSVLLKTQGQIPYLNLDNLDEIFKEHYVVDKMTDLVCPEQMACNLLFVKDEATLFFNKVCVNMEKIARIKITNASMIHTEVFCNVISGSGAFKVNPSMLVIEGYNCCNFSIVFRPTAIETFVATLEVSYNSMSTFPAKTLSVKLVGDGYVPEIVLLCPLLTTDSNIYELHYDSVMVGDMMRKSLEVENIGAIACQVLCSISDDVNDEFVIVPSEIVGILKHADIKVLEYKDHLFDMKPGVKTTLEIEYKPKTEPKTKSKLKLHIFNNPFEIFTILLNGESYNQDIKLENIEMFTHLPVKPPPPASRNRKAVAPAPPITYSKPCYELDFGHIPVNRLEKKYFKITNTSDTYTYKFELGNFRKLLFIPAVGHLKPKATKEIIVTFLTKHPVTFNREILSCKFYRIEYLQVDIEPLSWDERQNFIRWMPAVCSMHSVIKSDSDSPVNTDCTMEGENTDEYLTDNMKVKTVEGKHEPLYDEVPDTNRTLNIFLTVISDYCRLHCTISDLAFDDTLLFEKRNLKFSLQNRSDIPLVINWQIVMDSYPKRFSSDPEKKDEFKADSKDDVGTNTKVIEKKRPQTCAPFRRVMKMRQRPAPLMGGEKFITNSQCSFASRPTTARSSLFSISSGGTSHTRDSWCDADVLPFTIHPQNFAIPPKNKQVFTVIFAPTDVYQFIVRIKSNLDNLAPGEENVDIEVTGNSLLPLYYFNIEPTDYLVRRKCAGKRICDDLVDENTRIIEFEAIGVGHKVTKTFTVINPTGEEFSYRWIPHHSPQLSHFRCHTIQGIVIKGKMVEAVFSFLPQGVGVFEEYFTFHIKRYDLKALFLLVGTTREPCVFFNTPSIQTKPTVIGIDVCQYVELKNNESIELGFKFVSASLWGERRLQRLNVEPKSGVLKPNSETRIKIIYHPTAVAESNFYLKCVVEKRSAPCILCVVTNCFAVEPRVLYVDYTGSRVALDPIKMNTIELTALPPMHKYRVPVFVENVGRTGFYFNWTAKEKYNAECMKINFKDKEGYVKHGTTAETSFVITALKYLRERRGHIILEVLYGPSFPITAICSTSKVLYTFSFEEYNFGPCLVQLEKSMYYKINLQFTNLESVPAILDYSAEQLNHLTVCFKAAQVIPKATETIKIYFHPMQTMDYEDDLVFYVNSKIHKIKIKGSGVPINLELEDYRDKYIDLGSPYKGTVVQKTIKIVNNGLCSVSVAVNLYNRLPIFSRPSKNLSPLYEFLELSTSEISVKEVVQTKKGNKRKKSKGSKDSKRTKRSKSTGKKSGKKSKSSGKSKRTSVKSKRTHKNTKNNTKKSEKKSKSSGKKSKGSGKKSTASKRSKKKKLKKMSEKKLVSSQMIVESSPEETAAEKEKRQVHESVQISPKAFITIQPKKTVEFVLKFLSTERIPQFTEKIFYEIQDHVDVLCMFKGSVLGSEYYLERDYITFTNIFKGCKTEGKLTLFNTGDIGGKFKWRYEKFDEAVTLSPMEGYISTNTNVIFTITFAPMVIQCAIRARLKCTIDHFDKTLNLLVNGSASDYPTTVDIISFECPVRSSTSQTVTIQNITCEHWNLTPMVTLSVFEVPHKLSLDPQSSSTFDVIYKPIAMTKNSKDIGMLFLHTPNGKANIYQLEGNSLRPESISIEFTIPCKQDYIHIIPVKNWLRIPQLFKVINEVLPTETSATGINTLYRLIGNDYIEVPGLGERNYKWIIHVINEGKLHFKTKLRHEPSGEYIAYEIFVTVTKCPALGEIHLSTCARQTKPYKLKFENSIGMPVDFHFQTNSSNLEFPDFATLRPYSEYYLDILYTPLITSETKEYTFEASTKELGVFPYVFHLTAGPSIPEKMVSIEAPLGLEKSQMALLVNLSDSKADFTAKLEDPSIFYLPSNVTVGAKDKTYFEICFEPSTLGAIESKLLLTSTAAGEYIYPLRGIGTLPKPQGPYVTKTGSSINIQIKNPFFEQKMFVFETNSANFDVKPRFETIKGKQTYKILVNVLRNSKQDSLASSYPLTGKLTVTCKDAMYSDLKWVYYLQAD